MGINKQVLKLLLAENEFKNLHGRILLIGRSTVTITYDDLSALFESFGINTPTNAQKPLTTKHQTPEFHIDDKELFGFISGEIESVDVLDISDYEGANIICDLNDPISDDFHNRFDFIYDSSVLDNIFNPAQGIVNISRMLKPGGRYLGINVASFFPGAFVSCHPEWFYSFFAANSYSDVKVFLTSQEDAGLSRFEYTTHLYSYKPTFTPRPDYDYYAAVRATNSVCYSMVIAEKPDRYNISQLTYPVNLQYVKSAKSLRWDTRDFTSTSFRGLRSSDVRLFKSSISPPRLPHLTDHYEYVGSGF
jgi:hypothetical protein